MALSGDLHVQAVRRRWHMPRLCSKTFWKKKAVLEHLSANYAMKRRVLVKNDGAGCVAMPELK